MLTLYYARHTISLATHILLEEVGASYKTVRIDFDSTQQRSPEYLKINPKGRMNCLCASSRLSRAASTASTGS